MRCALAARGTRRETGSGGAVAASMSPHGLAIGEGATPESWPVLKTMHTDIPGWSLPTHRRRT
ncbi:hypothetical protein XarbCFBP8147_12100 [Xanthomonas arboricola]|nr:hypothetical protein XarbCFBP8147_12100 [Xanthomonas arboricola]